MKIDRGIAGLCLASLLVALAILIGDPLGRAINGIAGLLWIASAVVTMRRIRSDPRWVPLLLLAASVTTVLVVATRPSHYLSAAIGFAVAGAIVAAAARPPELAWAATVPALWLPLHLGVAVIRALDRTIRDLPASVRTEPPPTSALVPFVMVIAALLGGIAIQSWRGREITGRSLHKHQSSKI